MSRPLLVLGERGQVARELAHIGPAHGFHPLRLGRATLDLTQAEAGAVVDRTAPALVVNAAGYTAVDLAEQQEAAAFALNADLPGRFAQACARRDIPFLHISSDYVFDGDKSGAYVEADPVRPLGAYGRSKAAGEAMVESAGGRTAIVRTAWVYSAHAPNFLTTVLGLAARQTDITMVADQFGAPTWARDVAEATLRLGQALLAGEPRAEGLFHAAGEGRASWASLAQAIVARSAAAGGPQAQIHPTAAANHLRPAPRPANSVLDSSSLAEVTGWRPPPWRSSLAACMAEMDLSHAWGGSRDRAG